MVKRDPLRPQCRPIHKQPGGWHQFVRPWVGAIALVLGVGMATPSVAAERIRLRLGPLTQTIAIADLETFAKTGELSPALKPYGFFLTRDVQQILSNRLHVDPEVGDRVMGEVLQSPMGDRLVDAVEQALPDVTLPQLQTALALAARQAEGLNVIEVLKAFPAESLTVDVSATVALASQINVPYWSSQALGPLLEKELAVASAPWQAEFDPGQVGHYSVKQRTLRLHDSRRDRNILVDLYWSRSTQGPLVVISHGFGADRTFLSYLARHLASYGLTVAALEHPYSNAAWLRQTDSERSDSKKNSILPPTEFLDRPQDVSFLLDELAKLNEAGWMRNKLNTQQVSVIGHSLGGYTALALAGAEVDLEAVRQFCQQQPIGLSAADWLQCAVTGLPPITQSRQFRDRRVVQVMALNPVIGQMFGKTGLSQVAVPTLILAGTDDVLTPAINHQLQPFQHLPNPKYLIGVIGGTHLSVGDPDHLNPTLTRSTLVKERRGEDVKPLRHLLKGVSLAFIQQLTPDAERYKPFLTSEYAQSLSTPQLPLRLTTQLPAAITGWLKTADSPQSSLLFPLAASGQCLGSECATGLRPLILQFPITLALLGGLVSTWFLQKQKGFK